MATFIPEQESSGSLIEIDCDEPNSWYVSSDEAREALNGEWVSEALLDTRDPRLPLVALAHAGPYSVDLRCTGCGESTWSGTDMTFADHAACAPDAPDVDVPALSGPELTRPWVAAARQTPLMDEFIGGPDDGTPTPHTIELRFDVTASPTRVDEIAATLADLTGGRHTATFDEDWNETDTTDREREFQRPAHWPTGYLHANGIVCPHCGDHFNVHVEVTATAHLTEEGSEDVGDHGYTAASAAECRTCSHRGSVTDFEALPPEQQLTALTAVSCEWSTDSDVDPGAALWADLSGQQMKKAYEIALRYWPGIQVVADDQCLSLLAPEALTDPLNKELSDAFGSPASIT